MVSAASCPVLYITQTAVVQKFHNLGREQSLHSVLVAAMLFALRHNDKWYVNLESKRSLHSVLFIMIFAFRHNDKQYVNLIRG